MAFTWFINSVIWDIVIHVLIDTPHKITCREYWIEQQPWSTLSYLAVFIAPFLG